MIKVDRMVVRVPASMRSQAERLVRQAVRQLAEKQPRDSRSIEKLDVGPVSVRSEMTVDLKAWRVADAVRQHLHSRSGGES